MNSTHWRDLWSDSPWPDSTLTDAGKVPHVLGMRDWLAFSLFHVSPAITVPSEIALNFGRLLQNLQKTSIKIPFYTLVSLSAMHSQHPHAALYRLFLAQLCFPECSITTDFLCAFNCFSVLPLHHFDMTRYAASLLVSPVKSAVSLLLSVTPGWKVKSLPCLLPRHIQSIIKPVSCENSPPFYYHQSSNSWMLILKSFISSNSISIHRNFTICLNFTLNTEYLRYINDSSSTTFIQLFTKSLFFLYISFN